MMDEEPGITEAQPGVGRRLGRSLYRILRAFIISLLLIALLAGVAWGGLWLYQTISGEIDRSAASVATRFSAQESRIDILRREVDTLLSANPGQEQDISDLQRQSTQLNGRLDALARSIDQQSQLLTTLEASLAVTLANDAAAVENITGLNEALTILQTDFNTSTGQIDALGGEIDGLAGAVNRLQTDLGVVEETAAAAAELSDLSNTAVSEMAQSLVLFRAWELVARARLRLLETNFGLAANDVDNALETVTAVITLLPEDSADRAPLEVVQTRLSLAAANLPANPNQAAADLESAWDELDQILTTRLLPLPAAESAAATESETAVTNP
ncbi:MAG: hypothetical protein IPM39_25110 [Chloroflexi bacterium]|nr:hypothetical protein [Chloroflexota bacterium]